VFRVTETSIEKKILEMERSRDYARYVMAS
jgi:hypothetical protein